MTKSTNQDDEVLVRVGGVGKKFCREMKKSFEKINLSGE
ncbi:hypothetical protein Thi970DRAFT_01504 [Thiorhodovibrio frisius]|uniref:Uncharacterized protein n=2 Tax=Thiorhodovibrio frisius TaxID=631362 RepID=H8Z0R9_9GAMM|nr:hypothetical protein Thi970DRAFT_01504 [Thiorhodovibrio frisius]WPL23884.1 hypothetical protein Thiofri_04093 [Thiorhodovibrio frisius]